MERVGRDVHDEIAWEQFAALTAQRHVVGHVLQAYDAPTL
jgi:hypothetical protein